MSSIALNLYVHKDAETIAVAQNISAIPDEVFCRPLDLEVHGADIYVFVASTQGEADAFVRGIEIAVIGDDNTYSREHLADGRFIVIVHFGDSEDEQVRFGTPDGNVKVVRVA